RGQLAEGGAAAAGAGDRGVGGDEAAGGDAPAPGRRGDQPGPGAGGGHPQRGVEGVDGVGPAGELVPQQLGPGVLEDDVGVLQPGADLVGDDLRDGGGDALADLGPGEAGDDPVLRRDLDHQQVLG